MPAPRTLYAKVLRTGYLPSGMYTNYNLETLVCVAAIQKAIGKLKFRAT